MNRGYIRVWRKIEDSGIMGNPEVCRLFLYLMLKAASRPRKQMIGTSLVPLEPGQAIVGRKMLAAELGTTEGKIRTGLAALQKMEIIDQRPTNKFTVISILNWTKYQNGHQQDNQQTANKQPAHNQHTTTNKNKEYKNTLNHSSSNTLASPSGNVPVGEGVDDVSIEFLELRAYYDKHAREEAPGAGVAEYRQCLGARIWPGLDVIFDAVDALAAGDDQWMRGYAPGLAKFLREKQWQKKPASPKPPARGNAPSWAVQGGDPTIFNNLSNLSNVLARRQGGEKP